ncbi:uncharacterized protein JN550_003320 [Neoarthrinium moseri]|uniref:uncharacterized protein n=1 Tax=Neoarthrinium moseri TaxID=1658444 RepID=UPI001FDB086E|nr:uncharacterized protein JN550_003320 [Neoarthrinium moseri]KAI1873067.1 hypothetical protein JN550_003320 [Neoarthrinium moseri]
MSQSPSNQIPAFTWNLSPRDENEVRTHSLEDYPGIEEELDEILNGLQSRQLNDLDSSTEPSLQGEVRTDAWEEKADDICSGLNSSSSDNPDIGAEQTESVASFITDSDNAHTPDDLETVWIMNQYCPFSDNSGREKFFFTYQPKPGVRKRVTITFNYQNAPDASLEANVKQCNSNVEKNARIYEAIHKSLPDIDFFDTVTNLRLVTDERGKLHVIVLEDVSEIISYPEVAMLRYIQSPHLKESDVSIHRHLSGFIYTVTVGRELLMQKDIPGPHSVEDWLYEVNCLYMLESSRYILSLRALLVDESDEKAKGFLVPHATRLIDVFFDIQEGELSAPWDIRVQWAYGIIHGLSDVHVAGLVHGNLTLFNVVIDCDNNPYLTHFTRSGCPNGWEPPELDYLISTNQKATPYLGVASDLYQLGMTLWAIATLDDEPESQLRPLSLDNYAGIPQWYRDIVAVCLSSQPRQRRSAQSLLDMFPLRIETENSSNSGVGFSLP